VQKIAQKTV